MFHRPKKGGFERSARMSSVGRGLQVCLDGTSPQAKQDIISLIIIRGRALSGGEGSA